MIRLVIEMGERFSGEPEWMPAGNCTVDEFIGDNEEGLDAGELAAIRALAPGGQYSGGGGAAPIWRVTAYEAERAPCAGFAHEAATPTAWHLGQSKCPTCGHWIADDDGSICGIVPREG